MSLGAHHKNMNEDRPILSPTKSPGIAVSSEIKFMRIFAGFAGEGASDENGDVKNGDFRLFRPLYLPNLHIQGHNYYIVLK